MAGPVGKLAQWGPPTPGGGIGAVIPFAPTPIETHRGMVHPSECDLMGHMNVQFYMTRFSDAGAQLSSLLGITLAYMEETGAGLAALEQHIFYEREMRAGDATVVVSCVTGVEDKILRYRHWLKDANTGKVAAHMDIVVIHFDRKKRRASALPDFVRENARIKLAPQTD